MPRSDTKALAHQPPSHCFSLEKPPLAKRVVHTPAPRGILTAAYQRSRSEVTRQNFILVPENFFFSVQNGRLRCQKKVDGRKVFEGSIDLQELFAFGVGGG